MAAMGQPVTTPTVIYEDNQAAIAMSSDPLTTTRAKHISLHYHYTRERVKDGEINVTYIETREMVADALTKSLPSERLRKHTKTMLG